jgi:hypothetical protein
MRFVEELAELENAAARAGAMKPVWMAVVAGRASGSPAIVNDHDTSVAPMQLPAASQAPAARRAV